MVYQEQVMQIAVRMAGYSMAEADMLRQAMGKKIRAKLMVASREVHPGLRRQRVPGAAGPGPVRPDRAVRRLRVQRLARVRVRLHRVPDRVPEGAPPGRVHVGDPDERPRRQGPQALLPERVPADGLEVLPPDVNESELDFAPVTSGEPKIRYGLSAVRNVGFGRGAADHRGAAREGLVHRVRGLLPQGRSRRPDQEGAREPDPTPGRSTRSGTRAAGARREPRTRSRSPISAERKAEAAGQFSLFGGGEQAAN